MTVEKFARVLVFGDSITYGAWDSEGGWVQRLRKKLDFEQIKDSDKFYLVYNLGISGETSTDLLNRIKQEAIARREGDGKEGDVIVIQIGGNDSSILSGKPKTTLLKFEKNIRKIIAIGRKISKKVVFVGMTPAYEDKTMPVSWNPNLYYDNNSRRKYGNALKQICKKEKVLFIDIFEKFYKSNYINLLEDGLHPNSKGHLLIFRIVSAKLKKIIE